MFDYRGIHGPDVSFYQDDPTTARQIDFRSMKSKADFVIIRCSQNTWVDPDYSYNIIEARKAGLPVGVYHFYDSRATPVAQANYILSLTKGLPLELGIWLDLEERYNGSYKGWWNWKRTLEILRANHKTGIYTGPYYWRENMAGMTKADLDFFGSFDLWIANYDVLQPAIPAPWTNAILWQIGTPSVGLEYGAESLEIDMNYFNGTREMFESHFNLSGTSPIPDEPPTGGNVTTVTYWQGVAPSNIDTWNDINKPKSGAIRAGATIRGNTKGATWTQLTSPACFTKSSFLGSWYKQVTITTPDEPPVTPPPPAELPDVLYIGTDPANVTKYQKVI